MKNILLTGPPGVGKTTVIKKVVSNLKASKLKLQGFYSEEERSGGRRIAFVMHTLDGQKEYLAHQNFSSKYSIRNYGVSIKNIESTAVPSMLPLDPDHVIIIDEIGKMECFCEKFKSATRTALDSSNIVLGTIPSNAAGFMKQIKERPDIEIVEISQENRDEIVQVLSEKIIEIYKEKNSKFYF